MKAPRYKRFVLCERNPFKEPIGIRAQILPSDRTKRHRPILIKISLLICKWRVYTDRLCSTGSMTMRVQHKSTTPRWTRPRSCTRGNEVCEPCANNPLGQHVMHLFTLRVCHATAVGAHVVDGRDPPGAAEDVLPGLLESYMRKGALSSPYLLRRHSPFFPCHDRTHHLAQCARVKYHFTKCFRCRWLFLEL